MANMLKVAPDAFTEWQGTQTGGGKVVLYDENGNPVEVATEATLAALQSELALVKGELATIKANQTSGDQKVQLSGTIPELSSRQYAESASTVQTYNRADGAERIEMYVETGRVRIRTDGQPCTATTGEPLGEGFGALWAVPNISVFFVDDAVITVVSR